MATLLIDASSTIVTNKEAILLMRGRGHWLRVAARAGYRVYLLLPAVYLGWLGTRGFALYGFGRERNWTYAAVCAIFALSPWALAGFIARDLRGESLARRAGYGPVKFIVTEDGISGVNDTDVVFSDPWTQYAGFLVGRYVIVCPRVNSSEYLRIPIDGLTVPQRDELELLLSRHLRRVLPGGSKGFWR